MVTVMVIPYHQLGARCDLYPYLNQYAVKRITNIRDLITRISQESLPLGRRACRVDKHGKKYHALVVIEVLLMRDILQKLAEEGKFLYDLLLTYAVEGSDHIEELSCPVLQCMHMLANPTELSFKDITRSANYSCELFFLEEMLADYERLLYLTESP